MKKQIVVIGLGKFGTSVATELYQLGHDVLAIDLKEKNVRIAINNDTSLKIRKPSVGILLKLVDK